MTVCHLSLWSSPFLQGQLWGFCLLAPETEEETKTKARGERRERKGAEGRGRNLGRRGQFCPALLWTLALRVWGADCVILQSVCGTVSQSPRSALETPSQKHKVLGT